MLRGNTATLSNENRSGVIARTCCIHKPMSATAPRQQHLTINPHQVAVSSGTAYKATAASTIILLIMTLSFSVFVRIYMGPIDSSIGNVTHPATPWREAKRCSKQLGLPSVARQSSLAFAPGTAGSVKAAFTWRRPVVLLIGDSITEAGEDDEGGWSSKLGKAYRRKADVINRGFGGYNTDAAMFSLAEILDSLCKQQILIALVWLGANDAAVPDASQGAAHVPLDRYAANLHSLASQLQQAGVQHVVLATPPPVWEDAPQAKEAGQAYPRTYNITSTYAAAVRTTAAKLQLPVLDVWRIFADSPNWQQKLLAPDGLHLTKQGQLVVYQGFIQLVNQQLPQIRPSVLPMHHPTWQGLYTGNLSDRIAAEQAAYEAQFGCGRCAD